MIEALLAALCPRPQVHHPVLVLPADQFQALTGVMQWGA